jgi:hypothetical protein
MTSYAAVVSLQSEKLDVDSCAVRINMKFCSQPSYKVAVVVVVVVVVVALHYKLQSDRSHCSLTVLELHKCSTCVRGAVEVNQPVSAMKFTNSVAFTDVEIAVRVVLCKDWLPACTVRYHVGDMYDSAALSSS